MSTKIVLPKWGMGIEEGTIVQWLKSEGEQIKAGEPLVEIETAKALQIIEAPVTGRLTKILVSGGETAAVNAEIGVMESSNG